MKIEDRLYGSAEIGNPVILELLESQELQRLKDVSQLGIPDEFYHFKGFNRYEHSIGVFLLLKYCRTNLEEQVAGLLHDISHTPFSHVYDWVMGRNEKEDSQDKAHKKILLDSNIPRILNKYGLNPERISNLENFKILDLEIPEICADRFDYMIRDPLTLEIMGKYFIKSIRIYNGKMVFSDKDSALDFGKHFLKVQSEHYASAETTARYHLFSDILKIALCDKIISNKDFSGTETPIIEKLKQCKNPEIQKRLNALSGKLNYRINEKDPSIILKKKFRYVDPLYIDKGGLSRLGETDEEFKKLVNDERKLNALGTRIDIFLE